MNHLQFLLHGIPHHSGEKTHHLANEENHFLQMGIDRLSGAIGGLSGDLVSLGMNDVEPCCSSCSHKGFNGSSPFRRSLLG
ncbi:hypothetical protein, partial [Gilvimarinus sp. 1_MG-2023]|uniref:hypothetical protein n=1 Tax=Gilvimarinus sp. 1_MG-2023 TaxID=3062638 RepID=UPI0026E3752C